MAIGFDQPLYILPFDHRGSFQTKMFGWKGTLTAEQTAQVAAAKQVIYDGYKAALKTGIAKQKTGILVDEQFGAAILKDAQTNGYITACPAEKSGQDEFDFEYGDDFGKHIASFNPTFCKVLVRYNPGGDPNLNRVQAERLKRLSDFLHNQSKSKYMFELLVPPEKAKLDKVKGDKHAYDLESAPEPDGKGNRRPSRRRRGSGRLEDRRTGANRRLRQDGRRRPAQGPRQGGLHHPGPW